MREKLFDFGQNASEIILNTYYWIIIYLCIM